MSGWSTLAAAQMLPIPGLGGLTRSAAPAASEPAAGEPIAGAAASSASDLEAVRRAIAVLGDEGRRSELLGELRALETALASGKAPATAEGGSPAAPGEPAKAGGEAAAPEAPAADSTAPVIAEDGLIAAISASLSQTGDLFRTSPLALPMDETLARAGDELESRAATSFGGQATLDFLLWALPGGLGICAITYALFRNAWLRQRRRLAVRPTGSGFQILRRVLVLVPFGIAPVLVIAGLASAWASIFALDGRQVQLFLALFSPLFAALLSRQVAYYILLGLGPTRGWRLVGYAQKRLLPWVGTLAAIAAITNLLREFSIRVAIGMNVADIATLAADLALALLTAAFVLRHRLTIRSLLLRGRREGPEGSKASGVLSSALHILATYWHVVALAFVFANILARLIGLGRGDFILQSSAALLYIVGGLAVLAFANVGFTRLSANMARGRTTVRRAILRRYLDIFHVLFQIAVAAYVVVRSVDVWGFDLGAWLLSDAGQRFVRPSVSLILVPAVIYAVWTTIDTAVTHSLEPTDSRGRQRNRSGRLRTLLPLLRNLVFVVLVVVSVIAMLANIGVDVTPLLAGAGVIGLAFSFGAQQLVQDVITGFFIIFEDTISVGDVVTVGAVTGTVEGLTIRTVRIRDGNGALHSMPFSQLKAVQNNSRGFGIFPVSIGLAFGADADRAMEVMAEVGREILTDEDLGADMLAPIEIWGVDGFTPNGVVLKGAIRCKPLQQWGVGREFNRRLKRRLDAEGIDFYAAEQRVQFQGRLPQEPEPAV
ncbi:mechanosensitive ion channel family protein [Aureimonas sp. AU12]|uniref:mechanosensitive ion channel family protein n=1 Tax=Aureimonas sp. AU12 TaxID=1638161 RepID=UPI000A669629|nr:mechanosensitive ion channel domain-containing protein [Aureimonas sp. AU12]